MDRLDSSRSTCRTQSSIQSLEALVTCVRAACAACIRAAVAHLNQPDPTHLLVPSSTSSTTKAQYGLERRLAASCSDSDDARMARLFAALRRQLDLFQRHNHHGQFGAACGAAAAAAGEAAASGLLRLAAAAKEAAAKAGRGEFLRSDAVEQLDILLDSAEALWSTGRCRL